MRLATYGASLSAAYAASPTTSVGVGLASALHRFSFSGSGGIASLDPWSEVDVGTLSLPLRIGIDRQWSLALIPSYQLARAEKAPRRDAARYGSVAALTYAAGPRQFIGFGASYYTGLDDDTVFPIVLVDWAIDERWRLANPLSAGPTGPAGLELVYGRGDGWEFGVGSAYRSLRFRLPAASAAAPGGTGTVSGVVGFLRAQYHVTPQITLSAFVGADFAGQIEVNAAGGRTLYSEDVGTSPMLALSLSGRF